MSKHFTDFPEDSDYDPNKVKTVNSMAEVYASIEKQFGDTMENLSKNFDIKINGRLVNPRVIGVSSDAEVEEFVAKPSPLSEPFNLSTDFKYSPLPKGHFRLLKILGVGPLPLVEMKDYPMDKAPPYAAVSYAWGREATSRAFFCNGQNFAVSAHVLDAFNHVTRDYQSRLIWIDAICINQEDEVEKASQVAAMQSIYSRAQEVLIWLGAAENNSEFVFGCIPTILNWAVQRCQGVNVPTQLTASANQQPPPLLRDLGHIFARPWFHRVWVVQELLLANNPIIFCGNRRVDWQTFADMTVLLMQGNAIGMMESTVSRRTIELGARSVFELAFLKRQGQLMNGLSIADFVDLLQTGRLRQVTEPVDRVWAYLGLAQPDIQHAAEPLIDYSAQGKRDYFKAYSKMVKLLLLKDPDLSILALAPSLRVPAGLPSWCPNFHAAAWHGGPIQFMNHPFTASGSGSNRISSSVSFQPNSDILQLRGFRVDIIDKTVKAQLPEPNSLEEELIPIATVDKMLAWEQKCLELAQSVYRSPKSFPEAHWRTLCTDYLHNTNKSSVMKTAYINLRTFLRARTDAEGVQHLSQDAKKALFDYKGMVSAILQRSYFSTRGGRVGLAPPRAESGDCIIILYGAKVPHVLRFGPDGAPAKLIGDAYVHGVMYGEALKMKGRGKDETFYIG